MLSDYSCGTEVKRFAMADGLETSFIVFEKRGLDIQTAKLLLTTLMILSTGNHLVTGFNGYHAS
jgi:hypothetical protein